MLMLTVKSTEGTFAVTMMIAGTPLRKKDIEGVCENSYSDPNPSIKSRGLNSVKRMLKSAFYN